ncbi:ClpX C4-type zinc finger protein [Pontiella agarivorans]|uniref:ClpX C4-type zinc finger protein n=1 Tax=Pontiella agarivorans TaxID=3038953 RepID=A0ABU5MW64_9BACT|nr:ClpX C4-type zinc finger protein [Pontiella agarivorans]MDZ8118410.1 ClpX C4-type zinc finger protein [Pontiella agarivorans]
MNCSFCGRSEDEVDVIVAATEQNVAICDECVEICNQVIAEERAKASE